MTLRSLRPLAVRASRLSATSRAAVPRRFLNTDTAPTLYTAHASVAGNQNGRGNAENLDVDLGMPKSLGGQGGRRTNPEELFAVGYGACFQAAMGLAAPRVGIKLPANREDCVVETDVHLVGDLKKADMGFRVDMKIKVKGLGKDDLEKLVDKTKSICPYVRATQGNVSTNFELITL